VRIAPFSTIDGSVEMSTMFETTAGKKKLSDAFSRGSSEELPTS